MIIVLDACAMIAYLRDENGAEKSCAISPIQKQHV